MTDGFMKALPGYLAIGMPAKEFWEGDPGLVYVYRDAYKISLKQKNYEMWLQGLYNYNAFSVVISNAIRRKGQKCSSYMEKPLQIVPLSEEEKAKEAETERQKLISYLNKLQKKWDKHSSQ